MGQAMTKININDQYTRILAHSLSIGTEINDLGWPWTAI